MAVIGCASTPQPETGDVGRWLTQQEATSWRLMNRNISPTEPKSGGGPKPVPGIVVAALSRKDPDYYFHWVRDSANIMHAVADVYLGHRGYADREHVHTYWRDFVQLSAHLQELKSPVGLGEPRYTVEGQIDPLPWSRPQYDGPALRALTLIRWLRLIDSHPGWADPQLRAQTVAVIKTDIALVVEAWQKRGFDIWEEYKADNFNTRLVQLVALEECAQFFHEKTYAPIQTQLEKWLDDHWDPARGFLRSQLAIEATDGYTTKKTDLDAAVIVTIVEAARQRSPAFTVEDDRVQATVAVLENLFTSEFPINQNGRAGRLYGRYKGDSYFGGNPFSFVTLDFARFYYQLARQLKGRGQLNVSTRNREFVRNVLGSAQTQPPQAGTVLKAGDAQFALLISRLKLRGDAILERVRAAVGKDGEMYEQIDKISGRGVSSPGIGWSHAALIEAAIERELAN